MTSKDKFVNIATNAAVMKARKLQQAAFPKEFENSARGDAERAEYMAIRSRHDEAYQARGWRAVIEKEHPLTHETKEAFNARLVAGLQLDGAKKLHADDLLVLATTNPAKFKQVEAEILARSDAFTRRPGAPLVEIVKDAGWGSTYSEFVGDKSQWLNQFRAPCWLMESVNGLPVRLL